ncbi:hypothetical protein ACFWIY_26015 [Streptomyces sioyaensis]|uniref:hypothetical protein n=1 Tax=Streptomyces sioyaensis TaxID=67364 RepID=UPI0036515733
MSAPISSQTLADHVSDGTAKALRAAMERLLAGRPSRTDGRLIKENLYREAGVSRATMNRAHSILADWDRGTATSDARTPAKLAATTNCGPSASKSRSSSETRIQLQSTRRRRGCPALHHVNEALRRHMESGNTSVAVLKGTRQVIS